MVYMKEEIIINGRYIGCGKPTYIIAEISANHNNRFEQAVALVKAAKASGADAVKLQTYTPNTITIKSDKDCFKIGAGTVWEGKTLYDLYEEAYMPWDWQPQLKQLADDIGIDLFSSPFDSTSVSFLEKIGVPAYKIASFELVDLPLIRLVAQTGKPLIISTGMATQEEISEAIGEVVKVGGAQVALLKCTSAYPASPCNMNLGAIPMMSEMFNVPIGLSDHTLGFVVPVSAVSLGACIVEKHLTLSRAADGPDSTFSLEPHEFQEMVAAVRNTERAVRGCRIGPSPDENPSLIFRRSLFAVKAISVGELLSFDNVRSIRPGGGLHPRCMDKLIGLSAACNIEKGTPLSWDLVEGGEPH
jgi:pseudaminic acid synthase